MKIILLLLCSFLLFQTPTQSVSVAAKTTVKQKISIHIQKKISSKKYKFTPIPKSFSEVSCQGFTLHFSNICTRTDLRTFPVTIKQNQQIYSCKLVFVYNNGTAAKYVPCQTLSTGTYSLLGFSSIKFVVNSSSLNNNIIQTPQIPSDTPAPTTPLPGTPIKPTQPPLSGYSYTLTAQTKKHEKISHAQVEIYLNHQCILSGATDDTGIYYIESTLFQPDTTYTVRIYKPVAAFNPAQSVNTDQTLSPNFEPQEHTFCFSKTQSVKQDITLYESPETTILPITICWSLDTWNKLASQHPSVKAELLDEEGTICLFEQTYMPAITAMTATIPLFEKERQNLPSGSYLLRISISDNPKTGLANTEMADIETPHTKISNTQNTFDYKLKLLHGEWITPVVINLP